jgi:dTDP-4-dehydrorhamnose reductase
MINKILVTGANGQVGRCFRDAAQGDTALEWIFAGSGDLDIGDEAAVRAFFAAHGPFGWCINCAAYTAVDKAESEPAAAERTNVAGVRHLSAACKASGAVLVHFSTDYVYHVSDGKPYTETSPTHPAGVYAATKLAGEQAALEVYPEGTMIWRVSWVYAAHGHNFVRTMLRLGAERSTLTVVNDQIGSPTYAPDLAADVLRVVRGVCAGDFNVQDIVGIWNYSNEGVASWYDFAWDIMRLRGLSCEVLPIPTSAYPTPAKRPAYSVLDKSKIKKLLGKNLPNWRDSLKQCLLLID